MLLDVALHNIRDRDFQRDQHYVLTRLAQEHEPVVGMDALPEPVRTMTRNVAFSYEYIGAMVALGLVDSDLALSVLHFRVRQVWTALEPYARTEREIRNAPFLPFFEISIWCHLRTPLPISCALSICALLAEIHPPNKASVKSG